MKFFLVIICILHCSFLWCEKWLTVPEKTDYQKTSLYTDVVNFIYTAKEKTNRLQLVNMGTSAEGRMIPMVVVSQEGFSSPIEVRTASKPSVLIVANIHAGEVEGKEATQMLLRNFAEGKLSELLRNQVILIIPIFNPDGNDRIGKNRRDNGPPLAGTRANAQNLDLNRDFMKLETPEVRALIDVFNTWDPVLFVDMHTTNGSYHREPVTYTTLKSPNSDPQLMDYMWDKLFPEVAHTLKKQFKYDSLPYGNFVDRKDPSKGWKGEAYDALYSTNYIGLRNRFTILNENYAYADFKTRVLGSYGFIRSILQFTHKNIHEMAQIVKDSDLKTRSQFYSNGFATGYKVEKLCDVTVMSYEFRIENIKPEDRHKHPPWRRDYVIHKTKKLKNYRLPYFAKVIPTQRIPLPEGYLILPHHNNILNNLRKHGIQIKKLVKDTSIEIERYTITKIKSKERMYQGHFFIDLEGEWKSGSLKVPQDAYVIPMKQPLARLIPELLEPSASVGLLKWGFFNHILVKQWMNTPNQYPVFRIKNLPSTLITIGEPNP